MCVRFAAVAALWKRITDTTVGRLLLSVVAAVVAIVLVLFVVVSVIMIRASTEPSPENATVVVLGAGLRGEQPSRILRARLDKAAEFLNAHPQAACIVSGGQGADEPCTEASVMQKYLVRAGIAPERIYVEDRSTSTFENIQFSKDIIKQNGLPTGIAVVTQEFHQYRAQQFARAAGFTDVGSVTAQTEFVFFGSYWIREFAGICRMWLLGY